MSNLVPLETTQEVAMPGKIQNRISEIIGRRRWKIKDLEKVADISYQTALALYHDQTTQISFEVMAKLCKGLGVQVGDLFVYEPGEEAQDNGDAE